MQSTSPINLSGHLVYNSFVDVVVFDEIMRQRPDQQKLIQRLNHIHTGNVTKSNWEDTSRKVFASIPPEER